MKKRLRKVGWVASHLAAFAVGWVVWKHSSGHGGNGFFFRKETSGTAPRLETARRSRDTASSTGDRILDRLVADAPLGNPFKGWERWTEDSRIRYQGLLAKAAETPVADDPAAEALAALDRAAKGAGDAKLREEATVRLIHWLRADPDAAIRASVRAGSGSLGFELVDAAMSIAMEKGPAEVAGWLKGDNARLGSQLRPLLARQMAVMGDLEGIKRLKDVFTPEAWTEFRRMAADSWPLARAEELMAFLHEEGNLAPMANLAHAHGADGALWIENLLASGKLSEAEKDAIRRAPMYAELMWGNPTVPMERRLEVLSAYRPGKSPEQIIAEIAGRDVAGALRKEQDYRYAFRNGVLSADEVLAEVSRQLPQLAAGSAEVLRESVFKALAKEDGARALHLLDTLPGDEKWDAAMAVAPSFREVNPQQFYDYLQAIPVDATPERWQQRMNAWSVTGADNHIRLGRDYAKWVKQLPDGLDKDMASYALVRLLGPAQPDLTGELAANIHDPKIRGMLSSTP